MKLYDFLERQQEIRIKWWKNLTPRYKHFFLMYLYRLHTDPENILDYIEAHRFYESRVCISDFPDFVLKMKPIDLKYEAYEILGKLGEMPPEPA